METCQALKAFSYEPYIFPADPFFYPTVPADNLDYQRLLVYLSQCTEEQITTILAIVEAYLRTYKNFQSKSTPSLLSLAKTKAATLAA